MVNLPTTLPDRLLRRVLWRHWRRHPWQLALCLFGITLGVALVYAVELANRSALVSFEQAMAQVSGRATHQLVAGDHGIDERLYLRLRTELGLWQSAPLLLGRAELQLGGETRKLQLLGIDPFAESNLRGEQRELRGGRTTLLASRNGAALSASVAAELGLQVGVALPLHIAGRTVEAQLASLLDSPSQNSALDELLIVDIASAQKWLGRVGRLDRIDLILPNGPPAALLDLLREPDFAGVLLVEAEARNAASRDASRAFRDSLRAMSLLALLISAFLIYNAVTLAALQRREQIGLLRGLGATRAQLFGWLWAEALLLGAIGAAAGLLLGQPLGHALLGLMARTLNDLYAGLGAASALPDLAVAARATALGISAALLAALPPVIEAANSPPRLAQRRSVLERRSRSLAPLVAICGLALICAGGLLLLNRDELYASFAAALLVVLGYALLTPLLVLLAARWLAPLGKKFGGGLGRLGARSLADGLSRSAVAVAALSVAVAATVGIGLMIGSFRASLETWLLQTLQADIYLSQPGNSGLRSGQSLPDDLPAQIRALPQISAVSAGRAAQVETDFGAVELLALQPAPRSRDGFPLLAGDADSAWPAFERGDGILISEPFARHHDLRAGEQLRLFSPAGAVELQIGGIFRDYGSDQGLLVLHRDRYRALWGDDGLGSLGIWLRDGVAMDDALAALESLAAEYPGAKLRLRPSARIRELSLEVFERTFAVTRVLRLLTVLIAFAGVLGALLALQLERGRDTAILRAVGATPGQTFRLVAGQTLLMGALAGLLALPLGVLLGEVLIGAINPRAFGWSIDSHYSAEIFGGALLLAIGAAALAGLYPSWRAARTPPARALRDE